MTKSEDKDGMKAKKVHAATSTLTRRSFLGWVEAAGMAATTAPVAAMAASTVSAMAAEIGSLVNSCPASCQWQQPRPLRRPKNYPA